jgi:hypothetical protein
MNPEGVYPSGFAEFLTQAGGGVSGMGVPPAPSKFNASPSDVHVSLAAAALVWHPVNAA